MENNFDGMMNQGDSMSPFYGEPFDLDPGTGAAAIEAVKAGASPIAVITKRASATQGFSPRVQALSELSGSDRMAITRIPIVSVTNGSVRQSPIAVGLNATNVNQHVSTLLVEYPYEGVNLNARGAGVSTTTSIKMEASAIPDSAGIAEIAVPFVSISLLSSQLSGRSGAEYEVRLTGKSAGGVSTATQWFSVRRQDVTQPTVITFFPYKVVANRPVPVLPVVSAGNAFTVEIKGLTEDETAQVTLPGYSTQDLAQVAKAYGLLAGIVY